MGITVFLRSSPPRLSLFRGLSQVAARAGGSVAEERVQRRLAAILAADVVAHVVADETLPLEWLKTSRRELFAPTVAEYGG